jgi:aminoglycoside phosphotransferase (APT) family kinase protein/NAD(P)-dependent dehydrogenase (short-subunit alcohol dehydrogenase family)
MPGPVTDVRGAVVVVTGGGSGIGAALARRFAAEGAAAVVLADLDPDLAVQVAEELGPAHRGIRLDVTDEAKVATAVDRIESELGPIGVWCSNAGAASGPGLGTDAEWAALWRLHVLAHVYAARTVLPRMLARGHGHLMVTASAAGLLAEADTAPYSVTKHAAVAIAEWLAIQHGGAGVGFSCLCPQGVRTPLLDVAGPDSATLASGEVIEPAAVADAVIEGLAAGRFLILPHAQVAEYEQRRATDRDRWLEGMRRLRAAARARPGQARSGQARPGEARPGEARPGQDAGMPDPQADLPGLPLDALVSYLDNVHPGLVRGPLRAELIVGGRSNLTYLVGDGRNRWVVRRPPLGHVLATAHDMAREYRVLSALASSPVPVPRTELLCEDPAVIGAPFYLMAYVPGVVYRTDADAVRELSPDRLHRLSGDLVRVLAALHALDPAQYGLADFGRPEGYLQRQLRRWSTQLDASRSREVPGIDQLHAELAGSVPVTQRHAIVHGDYRLDNVIAGPDDRVAAVLDWEMSTVGDPLTDVGLLHIYWAGQARAALAPDSIGQPGLGPVTDMVEAYAAHSGLDLSPLPWYVAFGAYKLAVILEGIHVRYSSGKTVGAGFERIGDAVGPLVAGGLRALHQG